MCNSVQEGPYWWIQGGAWDNPMGPISFHFHAVFGENWPNSWLAIPPLWLAPSPLEILDPTLGPLSHDALERQEGHKVQLRRRPTLSPRPGFRYPLLSSCIVYHGIRYSLPHTARVGGIGTGAAVGMLWNGRLSCLKL